MHDRVVQVALDQDVDAGVERGGEQHALPVAGGLVEQAADDRQEAEVGHVVGLVEDGDLHRAEVDVAGLHVVGEPAGAGDDDVDAGAQALDLRVGAHAAEDGQRLSDIAFASGASAASIWLASSRVGARISARGRLGRRLDVLDARRVSTGSRNA